MAALGSDVSLIFFMAIPLEKSEAIEYSQSLGCLFV